MKMLFGQCDCCGKSNRVLHRADAGGTETFACRGCHEGYSLADDADDIADEINRLRPSAETGEQWAYICALESAYVEATGRQLS